MRLRPAKLGFKGRKNDRCETGFAYLPKRLSNGTWVWLENYRRYSSYYGHYGRKEE